MHDGATISDMQSSLACICLMHMGAHNRVESGHDATLFAAEKRSTTVDGDATPTWFTGPPALH